MTELILASASPRRKELLSLLNLPFQIIPSDVDETIDPLMTAEEAVASLAFRKARHVAEHYPESVVIGSDTIVVQDKILGKPSSKEEARGMLRSLSGKTHRVMTAVCLMKGDQSSVFTEITEVTFWPLSDREIDAYLATDDPYDKAGAYGIQTAGALFVREISGDYYAVVGLPVSRLARELTPFL